MSKLFKWGLSVLALSVLAACGNSGSSEASKATGLSTGETKTSVPAEASKEESVPAQPSKEESVPAEASKEESVPAQESEQSETSVPAEQSEQPASVPTQESEQPTSVPAEQSEEPEISLPAEQSEEPETSLPAEQSEEPVQSTEEVELPVFYVCGSFNGWTQYDEHYKMSFDETNEIYYFEGLNLKAGALLKVMGDVDGQLKWYPNANVEIKEAAKYEIDFDDSTGEVTVLKKGEYEGDISAVDYYLTGDFAGWAAKDQYKLSFDETSKFYVIESVELSAGAMVKVIDSDNKWYPDGMGNDYKVTEAGFYTVHFDPQGGHEGWHAGFFAVLHASL